VVSREGGMLRSDALREVTPTPGAASPDATSEKPRKKLSFREPEIMGYYMQMKHGVTSRLSRRGKSRKSAAPAEPPPENNNIADNAVIRVRLNSSTEDLDLEVRCSNNCDTTTA